MSRWLMAVLVDFSIVMTAAASSIPLQIIQEQRLKVQPTIRLPDEVRVDANLFFDQENNASEDNYHTVVLEDIMPQADSVAGPLIFLGAGMLKIQELVYLPP